MRYLTIKPILGLKNDCPIDDLSLYQPLDKQGLFYATHDVGGYNIDYERKRGACSKAYGRFQWSNSATSQATKCLGLIELFDGTNRDYMYFDNGKFYVYDSVRDPQLIQDSGETTFANDDIDLYSIITFGGYMIFADRGEHTPYKWKHGDGTLTKLILSDTEYKFRYLTHIKNHIIGAYTGQSNGDLDIRWTNALPAWATLSFPAANQLYKPEGDENITGLKKLGANTGFVFSRKDITRLDYYPSGTTFGAITVLRGWGSVNHHSIISDGIYLYFFDEMRGFCRFDGVREPVIISDNIDGIIGDIDFDYYKLITSTFIPFTNELVWNVPMGDISSPNRLLFYNRITGQWRIERKDSRYLATFKTAEKETWTDLATDIGGTGIWSDAGSKRWTHYFSEINRFGWGDEDGHTYIQDYESDIGASWDGYRVEPVLPLPDPEQYKRIYEIWFDIGRDLNAYLHVYWRGADTIGELEDESWTEVGTLNMSDPTNPVVYIDRIAKSHQIKWGTDSNDEQFQISKYKVGYTMQGMY